MLNGVRIIEFEGLGPGPFAGMLLADLGAEVIVIHRAVPADTPGALIKIRSIVANAPLSWI